MDIICAMLMAVSFFTVIPMPFLEWTPGRTKLMPLFMPFVGLIIGAGGLAVLYALNAAPFSPILKAVLFTVYFLAVTGGVHFDGLMDTADAYFSRRDLARKLEIMTDSRVGAFAVMAAIVMLLLKFGVFAQLFEERAVPPIIVLLVPVLSRSLQITMLYVFPQAKNEGLAKMFGSNRSRGSVVFFYGVFALCCVLIRLFADSKFLAVPAALLPYYGFYYLSSKKNFGGVTGDILGAFVELSETLAWFAAVMVLASQ